MKTIVFLDDERVINDVYWYNYQEYNACHTVRNFDQFKQLVNTILLNGTTNLKNVLFSFDHDLQDFNTDLTENTGYTCVKWLCEFILQYGYDKNDLIYIVHSQNHIGKENIDCYIKNFKKCA